MSNDIQALTNAILEEAKDDARRVLNEAKVEVAQIRHQAQVEAEEQRKVILKQAREDVAMLQRRTVAAAQLDAKKLRLERREQLLKVVFKQARQRLSMAIFSPHQPEAHNQDDARFQATEVVLGLVREAAERMNVTGDVLVFADPQIREVLNSEMLNRLGTELGMVLTLGPALEDANGVILETANGHRRYDNTLESRLSRMYRTLRAPVYHILLGEAP